ncbi:MAG: sporulation transcriptional regulator SpoIIID [Clostridia bacterium]|nr:sporulation transcriptional regulator SpoIIID [Clostridia bacterium]
MNYNFDSVRQRCLVEAEYMICNGATVRATATALGISKSTVHKDVRVRLRSYDRALYEQALEVLMKNKDERHLRGGEATRIKYLKRTEKA